MGYEKLISLLERYSAAVMCYHLNMRDGDKRNALRQIQIVNHTRIELMHYGWTDADHEKFMAETSAEVRSG